MTISVTRRALLAAAAVSALGAPFAADAAPVKNTILFVSDGASWGTWDMASYWATGTKNGQPYAGFDVKLGMTTTPLNTSNTPTNTGVPQVFYDPAKAWDTTPSAGSYGGRPSHFNGYDYLKRDYTDSAAAGTALAAGEKTYNNAIVYDDFGQALPFISEQLKGMGKSVGVVSSVPISHATPAAFASQNISRNNYGEISRQMVQSGTMDLIMGGGHPFYDSNGDLRPAGTERFANETGAGGGFIAKSVIDDVTGPTPSMIFFDDKATFEALADGTTTFNGPILGVAQVGDTLQYSRGGDFAGANAFEVPLNDNVPTLETMTRGALNHLGNDADGFFVMIEGGAVDWAAHANNTARIIEEQVDFDNAVGAAIKWVEANSSWDETLMIVLTDHGNAMPMGPNSDTIPFEPIRNNGAGVLPGVMWHYGTHTNENTLLWAKGAGSELLLDQIVGQDPWLASILGHNATGDYIENTGVYAAIAAANGLAGTPAPVPLPATVWMLGAGLAALGGLRRLRRAA